MPTPNSDSNSSMEISSAPLNVDSTDGLSDLIMINSGDPNLDTFSALPIEFETSDSSIGTIESVEETINIESNIPMLTDIAEETIYETEFFDENVRSESDNCDTSSKTQQIDIGDIPIEVIRSDDSIEEITDLTQLNDFSKCSGTSDESDSKNTFMLRNEESICDDSSSVNEEHIYVTLSSDNTTIETTNTITLADTKDTSKSTYVMENVTLHNNSTVADSTSDTVEVVVGNSKPNNTSIFNISPVVRKVPTLAPLSVQNTSKLVPINIAPNSLKRPAAISIGQPSPNLLTKVLVSQNSRSLCLIQNTCANQSPVKSITFAQAQQMGLIAAGGKLHPIRPSITKPQVKPKVVVSSVSTVPPALKKIQPVITKPSTPTKILPAPLVSTNSTTASQPQKIFIRQVPSQLIPKQQTGQMITISNLQTPVISNHVSPKKQVQYIKLVNNIGSTNMPTVTTAKTKIPPLVPTMTKIDKDTPIIVASSNFTTASLNVKNATTVQTSSTSGTSGITVVPMLTTNVKTTPGQRLLLPAVSKSKDTPTQSLLTESKQQKPAGNIVVLPDDVLEKIKGELLQTPIKPKDEIKVEPGKTDVQEPVPDLRSITKSPTKPLETGNGLRSRKPCNCTRSQCLKLYCECFANGEFCNNCNCVSCHNNISHEENRQHAIRSCLDRNPQAFRPKIGKGLVGLSDRRHTKGCHCKRSGCLKNYCECYEAQIPCSENCKCIGCKNVDDMLFATSFTNSFEKSDSQVEFQNLTKNKLTAEINDAVGQSGNSANPRHAFSFVKDQVVEATCQCLLAQAEEVKRRNINVEDGKKYIIEEFGRCLIQIIDCAKKSCDNVSDRYVSS
ncbi:protein lin-54 homolog [Planococcus citri]|uniref:protein lin-54 homolog n=1 Tax=Planococcus citri TaxID=170843 RepID=UPI0031F7F776